MSEAGEVIDQILEWDGVDEEVPAQWIRDNSGAILAESATGDPGPIADVLDRIENMAASDAEAAVWGLAGFFGTVQNAASAAYHKTFGFVSAGVRRVTGQKNPGAPDLGNLWNALSGLFNRYSKKLIDIARKLHATGFSLGLNIPWGFTMQLNFDFRMTP